MFDAYSLPISAGANPSTLVEAEDVLVLAAYASVAGLTVTLNVRYMDGEGRPKVMPISVAPASNRTQSTASVALPPGILLGMQVAVSGGTPKYGQCYAQVFLQRGQGASALLTWAPIQGPITTQIVQAWPDSAPIPSVSGEGVIRSITGTTPAAGADISETVPTSARWQLLAFTAQLVTSSAVANRNGQFLVDDGANLFYRLANNANQTATQTFRYQWDSGGSGPQSDINNNRVMSLPDPLLLSAGYRLRTSTVGIDVADQWSLVQYLVREWLDL